MAFALFKSESLQQLASGALYSHRRFPFTLLISFVTAAFIIYLQHIKSDNPEHYRLLGALALGIPWLFSAEIFAERSGRLWLALGLVTLLLGSFYYFNPVAKNEENPVYVIRFIVLALVGHLLVAVAPYVQQGNVAAFWQYNKTLFLGILRAALYSITLSAGLCLALLAIKNLFDIQLDDRWFLRIITFIGVYGNTLFFVSKLPSLSTCDSHTEDYPMGLKYFSQFVLLPLVALYILILLSYELKIMVQWQLPKGWVSTLVLASGVFGILAFLLLYPLQKSSNWVARYTKTYYWLLLPLVLLMLVAIYVRIHTYGVTEPRYFVAIMSLWLLGIVLYFGFSKVDNIKIIPLSLIPLGLFSIFAPFNAFHSARLSQSSRFQKVLKENNIKIKAGTSLILSSLNGKDAQKIHAALEYLSENDVNYFEKYLSKSDFEKLKKANSNSRYHELGDMFKIKNAEALSDKFINKKNTSIEKTFGADYQMQIYANKDDLTHQFDGHSLVVLPDNNSKSLVKNIMLDGETYIFDLSSLTNIYGNEVDPQSLTFSKEGKLWRLILVVDHASFDSKLELRDFAAKLYIKKLP